ncbi:MAG: VOC family protein [Candidatus Eremiobacteraeota bacterium]|nr:VOC family protein [Candidatus Eremiobacteraeota bacterium]
MPLSHLFSHVDLRVRDADRSVRFYDTVLESMGLRRRPGGVEFISWSRPEEGDSAAQWLGITVDPHMVAGSARVCFSAADRAEVDRIADVARRAGALHFEPPHEAYGSDYYAAFFEDPDGNRLEVACFVE